MSATRATRRPAKLQPADTMNATPLFLLLWSVCPAAALSRASVMVTPSWSQHFEYDNISVSCGSFSSGEWTVWRYTAKGLELSQCGSGWGKQTPTTCDMKTVKVSDSGVYWCESKHRDSSNTINITVTGGAVILQSPVRPVMEGDDVTLHCKTKTSDLSAAFYKDGSFIRTEPTGHMTLHHVSRSDEGAYKCKTSSHGESPASWLRMKDDSDPASLTVSCDSSQQFEYDNLSLSCGDNSSFREWKVTRSTTSGGKLSRCGDGWGTPTHFGCIVQKAKKPDSAIYWCESPAKQRSNSANINVVYGGAVILQSPVRPVMEGDNVTLHCKTKTPTSDLPAAFYKDDSFIRTEPTGHMTLHHVSRSDEGLYRCNTSSHGESPPSWLFVRAPSPAGPTLQSGLRVIRHLVVFSPYFISTVLMLSLCQQKPTGKNPPVSMTTSQPSEDHEESNQPYDDVIADVTIEHNF